VKVRTHSSALYSPKFITLHLLLLLLLCKEESFLRNYVASVVKRHTKLEVTSSSVAEDTLERIWQYLGYRLNMKKTDLQQSLHRKSTRKIKHFYVLQHGICFFVMLELIFEHPDRNKNSQENYFSPSQNSNRGLQHEANNATATFTLHSQWCISPKE
jgi:hypothetical protein